MHRFFSGIGGFDLGFEMAGMTLVMQCEIDPYFLNKKTRSQIKETVKLAKARGLRAEFWFKQEPHPDVRGYVEDKEGIVIVWKKEPE